MTTFTSEDRQIAQSSIKQGLEIFSRISDVIVELHSIATAAENFETSIRIKFIADDLAKVGNEYYEYKKYAEEHGAKS